MRRYAKRYSLCFADFLLKIAFKELAEVLECESIAFKPLNEVRWISTQFALQTLKINIAVLIEYCKEQSEKHNDPACKYYYRKLTNPQVKVALITFNDVIREIRRAEQAVAKRQPDTN